ncbi:Uncharacterized conserved protein, DUF1330 family [Bradyrhizobium lablabi]|uniref:Uncharacterized conserved protein, DUF1330 family n=1 Tax=Bradyrhizobium lablabi TaxID=722472 RepID=A0A1M6RNW4_9BRAD|nr:DUF1330 domain-containing protein [Bradyrhizobium lablabi]SHK34211.1 Uncharacterized conserved protein, DUF1330 family [Bradyrhizobium lablabi]
MAAYFMVQSTINNEGQYQKYREAVVPLIVKFGGKLLVRGGKVEVLEGQPDGRPMVVFEFPSMEAIHAFWHSPDYAPVKMLRHGAATLNILAVPGI